jgi:hypothetical protein
MSGALERFLIARGERVVRVSTRLMAGTRRSSRERGKSDQIDAVSVARAALAAGIETLPTAALAGPRLDIRLLVDHRERLVRTRAALNSTLQWNLHDLWPELTLPGGALFSKKWTTKIGRRLARAEQTMRVRIARDELRRMRELTETINALEIEIGELVAQVAPQLIAEPGCGPLTAAKLVGEIAGADRFSSDAKLARAAGIAPIPASSGRTTATASTAAATARSTPRSTGWPSPGPVATRRPRTTSRARRPKARPTATPSAASSDTLPAASGTSCARPPRSEAKHSHDQILDIGAPEAVARAWAAAAIAADDEQACWSSGARARSSLRRRLLIAESSTRPERRLYFGGAL